MFLIVPVVESCYDNAWAQTGRSFQGRVICFFYWSNCLFIVILFPTAFISAFLSSVCGHFVFSVWWWCFKYIVASYRCPVDLLVSACVHWQMNHLCCPQHSLHHLCCWLRLLIAVFISQCASLLLSPRTWGPITPERRRAYRWEGGNTERRDSSSRSVSSVFGGVVQLGAAVAVIMTEYNGKKWEHRGLRLLRTHIDIWTGRKSGTGC